MSVEQIIAEAVEGSYANSPDAWKDEAQTIVKQVAGEFPTFTSEDVWDRLSAPETGDGSALGGVMRRAVKAGWIELIEGVTVPARIDTKHKRPTRVWRSKLHPDYRPTITDSIPLTKQDRENIAAAFKFMLDRYSNQPIEFKATASKFGVKI